MAWRKKEKAHLSDDQFGKEVASVDDDGCNEFVQKLKDDPEISAIFLYDDIGLGLGPKHKRDKGIQYVVHNADGSTDNGTVDTNECPQSVKDQVKISRADKGNVTGKVLIAAAWTTKEESVRFQRRPEVVSWGVTEGTNRECRGASSSASTMGPTW